MALAELARFTAAMNAEIAKGLLESHGLGAVIFDGGMNIADGAAIAIPVRLMVLKEDVDEALKLLKASDLI